MNNLLKPGYVRWDGTKYVTDPEIEIIGPQGPPGPTGLQGSTGKTGPQGVIGYTGPQGLQGSKGPQGSNSGFTGATGPRGLQGSQGLQGAIGLQGPQGPTGAQGIQGVIGNTGPIGYQGNIGEQGLQGIIGYQGTQGNVGIQGPTGSLGLQGSTGDIGPQGPTGSIGPQGPTGDNSVTFTAELETGLSVLDLVCVSSTATTSIKVAQASADDEAKMPVVGVLVTKNNDTEGVIVSSAIVELSGLIPGATYFVGTSGSITNIPPVAYTGSVFVQQIGVALTQTKLLLNLSPSYTERVL
jgi:hypothetical protein